MDWTLLVLRVATAIAALFFVSGAVAGADEHYSITGEDELRVVRTARSSLTSYNGSQYLRVTSLPNGVRRFRAEASVRVSGNGVSSDETAVAENLLSPDGRQTTVRNADPAYLTVLTQPFAVAVDISTLHDVTRLRKAVPFKFSSGLTGGDLSGRLSFRGYAVIDGFSAVGMTFNADGPIYSQMTGQGAAHMIGRVAMTGHAFYRTSDAILMKLVTTVVTSGTVAAGSAASQIQVTYYRRFEHAAAKTMPKALPK